MYSIHTHVLLLFLCVFSNCFYFILMTESTRTFTEKIYFKVLFARSTPISIDRLLTGTTTDSTEVIFLLSGSTIVSTDRVY